MNKIVLGGALMLSVWGLVAVPDASAQSAQAAHPAQAADHGRRLYHHGLQRDGQEVLAWVGPGARLPGTLAACTRCHGVSGRGSRDAGLQVPSLQWSSLMQDRAAGGGLLARPAYTEATLLRALREGLDSQGRPLAAAMPRFELSDRAAADLLLHLRRMGTPEDRQPGVDDARIRVGTVVPPGRSSSAAAAHTMALRACLDKANREGGIHGRQVELLVFEGESAAIERVPPWSEEILMLVGPWWPQGSAARLSRQFGPLPVIGPLGAASELLGATEWWFGVVPVPSDQIRIAIDHAARASSSGRVLVLIEEANGALRDAAQQAAQAQAGLHSGLQVDVQTLSDSLPGIRTMLQTAGLQSVVAALSGPALRAVAGEMNALALPAPVMLYGLAHQAGTQPLSWTPAEQSRLRLISAAVAESDFNPRPFEADLAALGERPSLPAIQAPAYAAACTAVEALRRAGRDLDREQLLIGLTAIQRLSTGVMPPLSFGPRQRHGVWQSRVLRVGRGGQGFEPDSGWQSPKVSL